VKDVQRHIGVNSAVFRDHARPWVTSSLFRLWVWHLPRSAHLAFAVVQMITSPL
jgi:hypothetical protein